MKALVTSCPPGSNSRGRPIKQADQVHQRGFSGARGTHDRHELALRHAERSEIERSDLYGAFSGVPADSFGDQKRPSEAEPNPNPPPGSRSQLRF